MSLHSYSRVWLHLIWATLERRPLLSKSAAGKVSGYLLQYASEKGVYMKINYVNPNHVHVLIDLPTNLCIEDGMQLLKGGSSHWINENNLLPGKFGWAEDMQHFRSLSPALRRSPNTLQIRKRIIERRAFLKSLNCLSSGTN